MSPYHQDPTPVRLACPSCGRIVIDGGRCDECISRSGSALGIVVAAFVIFVVILVVTFAASRGASDPGSPSLTGPSLREVPRSGLDLLGRGTSSPAPAPVLEAGSEGSHHPTTPMPAPYRGTASWYCGSGSPCTRGYGPGDLVAAIDRKDTEFEKGDTVIVRSGNRAVTVRIVDVCACPGERLIDLTTSAFRRLAPLSRGVIPVTVERAIPLPETDQ